MQIQADDSACLLKLKILFHKNDKRAMAPYYN